MIPEGTLPSTPLASDAVVLRSANTHDKAMTAQSPLLDELVG